MTKRDQKRFIKELAGTILAEAAAKIAQGKIPRTWDGVELRQYLADKFEEAVHGGRQLTGPRRAAYDNDIIMRAL